MIRDYWHKRCEDMSQVPDWFVQFGHWFEGDRQWTVAHHTSRGKLVLWQR